MPDIDQNISQWNDSYSWDRQGDEWSACWGGAARQWQGAILPRIRPFVPAERILEIAPGFGRWTQFLIPLCGHLTAVDLSEKCIDACQRRFADVTTIDYHVNDGRSLAMVADDSIDFAFSFDSLVHVEWDVLSRYLAQLATKLRPHGVAFLHHSNIGAYSDPVTHVLPASVTNLHWRGTSVSAAIVRNVCEGMGLSCVRQELVNWGGSSDLPDAFTVITPVGSRWAQPTAIIENREFMREAEAIRSEAAGA